MLDADYKNVGLIGRSTHSRKEPVSQILLVVRLYTAHVPRADSKLDVVDFRKLVLHLLQLLVDPLALFTGVTRIEMLALHDIDTCLHWILIKCVDKESSDNFCLVIQLAQEAFLAISGYSRDGRVGSSVLPTQVIAHFSPHGAQLLNDGFAVWLVHKSYSIGMHLRTTALLKIKTKFLHLDLQSDHTNLRLGNIRAIERI